MEFSLFREGVFFERVASDSPSGRRCLFQMCGIDALALSHDHADAMWGLDDLRDLQKFSRPPVDLSQLSGETPDPAKGLPRWYAPVKWIPCFLGERTFLSLCRVFCYLAAPYMHHKNAVRLAKAAGTLREAGEAELPGTADDPLLGVSEDGEFAFAKSGRLIMQRKVACLAFRLLNDQAPAEEGSEKAKPERAPLLTRIAPDLQRLARGNGADLTAEEEGAFFDVCPTQENGFSKIELPGASVSIHLGGPSSWSSVEPFEWADCVFVGL